MNSASIGLVSVSEFCLLSRKSGYTYINFKEYLKYHLNIQNELACHGNYLGGLVLTIMIIRDLLCLFRKATLYA